MIPLRELLVTVYLTHHPMRTQALRLRYMVGPGSRKEGREPDWFWKGGPI